MLGCQHACCGISPTRGWEFGTQLGHHYIGCQLSCLCVAMAAYTQYCNRFLLCGRNLAILQHSLACQGCTETIMVRADREELAAISGVTVAESDEPLTINLYFSPSRGKSASAGADVDKTFHFRISIPAKYPFHPPSFKWISRPAGAAGHTPYLGPKGDVSISALSQWTPASSLSNVLISLFPSETLAAQCCSVTSHIWLMGVRPRSFGHSPCQCHA